jgi:flagellar protein FliS
MYRKGLDTYRQTDILTADPKRLVMMCYQGAIDNLKTAKRRFEDREYEAKAKAIQKAQDFIDELRHSLDFEKGGEIANNLESLYNYMTRRLLHADVNGEIETFEEVIGMLEELKGAWDEIFFANKKHRDIVTHGSHMSGQFDNPVLSAAYGPPARS